MTKVFSNFFFFVAHDFKNFFQGFRIMIAD